MNGTADLRPRRGHAAVLAFAALVGLVALYATREANVDVPWYVVPGTVLYTASAGEAYLYLRRKVGRVTAAAGVSTLLGMFWGLMAALPARCPLLTQPAERGCTAAESASAALAGMVMPLPFYLFGVTFVAVRVVVRRSLPHVKRWVAD